MLPSINPQIVVHSDSTAKCGVSDIPVLVLFLYHNNVGSALKARLKD